MMIIITSFNDVIIASSLSAVFVPFSCDTVIVCTMLTRYTVVSRMVTFPDCFFPGKTFPGWSFSRMRRFPGKTIREW